MTELQKILSMLYALATFVALCILYNKIAALTRKPILARVVFYIDGQKGNDMQILKADKSYKIELKGEDRDGNPVAFDPNTIPSVSLSNSEAGEISPQADGSFILNPNKVGQVNIQAQIGELVGVQECEIVAGDLFKISMNVSEQQ